MFMLPSPNCVHQNGVDAPGLRRGGTPTSLSAPLPLGRTQSLECHGSVQRIAEDSGYAPIVCIGHDMLMNMQSMCHLEVMHGGAWWVRAWRCGALWRGSAALLSSPAAPNYAPQTMPRFAANLSLMYGEHAFLDRFAAAARDGFEAVEYLFPYDHATEVLAHALREHGLQQVLFNAPPGDWAAGERGLAALPGREAEFQAGLHQALHYAQALGCKLVHVMAGVATQAPEVHAEVYLRNLRWAAAQAERCGVTLLIEPLNPRDMPGYWLQRQAHAHEVVAAVGSAHLQVQMDIYHCQIVEGDVSTQLCQYLPTGRVGHIQIASVPERHEPHEGELNYAHLFALIDRLGYRGHIGCEYRPRGETSAGVAAWRKALLG
jgi:2-dehydrotetronate isomerase